LADWQKMGVLKEMTRAYLGQETVKQEIEDLVDVLLKKKQTTGLTIGRLGEFRPVTKLLRRVVCSQRFQHWTRKTYRTTRASHGI
jgi:uncharacterized protein YejL (UPF0352 family)